MYATSAGARVAAFGVRAAAAVRPARPCRMPARRADRGGRPGQLQRLPPLLRRLPLRRRSTMVPHPDASVGAQLAQVDADLCASCGICVGACPSSTPFRSAAELVTGIDMPQMPIGGLRRRLERRLAAARRASDRIVVFGCDHGANVAALAGTDVASFSLICTGMLPPSFVEYALRGGAAGVLVTGCRARRLRIPPRQSLDRRSVCRDIASRICAPSVPRERLASPGPTRRGGRAGRRARRTAAAASAAGACSAGADPIVASTWISPRDRAKPLAWIGQALLYRPVRAGHRRFLQLARRTGICRPTRR